MTPSSPLRFLRIAMGLFMALHGLMKLLEGPAFWSNLGGLPPWVPESEGLQMALGILATAIELVGGFLVLWGRHVRCAALAVVAVMLAAFTYHLPNVNGLSTLMYNTWPLEIAAVFLALAWAHPPQARSRG